MVTGSHTNLQEPKRENREDHDSRMSGYPRRGSRGTADQPKKNRNKTPSETSKIRLVVVTGTTGALTGTTGHGPVPQNPKHELKNQHPPVLPVLSSVLPEVSPVLPVADRYQRISSPVLPVNNEKLAKTPPKLNQINSD